MTFCRLGTSHLWRFACRCLTNHTRLLEVAHTCSAVWVVLSAWIIKFTSEISTNVPQFYQNVSDSKVLEHTKTLCFLFIPSLAYFLWIFVKKIYRCLKFHVCSIFYTFSENFSQLFVSSRFFSRPSSRLLWVYKIAFLFVSFLALTHISFTTKRRNQLNLFFYVIKFPWN